MEYPKQCKRTTGSGMSKIYYHTENDYWGWLEFKDNETSKKTNSIKCYNNLLTIKDIHLPQIIDVEENNYPKLLDFYGENCKEAKCGYFIQHLNIKKTFKPKMCAFSSKLACVNSWGITSREHIDSSINDMENIENHLGEIVKEISELTLAFDVDEKKIFLLDFEKPEIADDPDTIRKGVENIITVLKDKF